MPARPDRRRHHLVPSAYQEDGRAFSITLGTSPRLPVFADLAFGRACIEILTKLHETHQVPIYVYCLMPDHVHLLVGVSPRLPLPRFVQQWKSLCYRARRNQGEPDGFWQRGYFDHAIRRDEDLQAAADYILQNPVRAGLVDDFRCYPLCGSLEWQLR